MKSLKFLAYFGLAAVSAMVMGACGPATPTTSHAPAKTYTVTFYDGETVLKTETVKENAKVERWTPVKEGYTFIDWYATPSFTHVFDFNTPIVADTSIFAKFESAAFTPDTRDYYILGSGTTELLMISNWGAVVSEAHKLAKNAETNEYSITLDLFDGDEFQFAINKKWEDQRGFGYLTTTKTEDGTECFSGAGGLGETPAKKANIHTLHDGNYTFVLKTHPGEDLYDTENPHYSEETKENYNYSNLDSIRWTYNGEAGPKPEGMINYYIKGAGITDWKNMYNKSTMMVPLIGAEKKITLSVYLRADEEFLFITGNTVGGVIYDYNVYIKNDAIDEASAALFDKPGNGNIIAKAAGTYTFVYDLDSKALSATLDETGTVFAADLYVDGTYGEEAAWSGYCFKDEYMLKAVAGQEDVYAISGVAMKQDSEFILQAFKPGSPDRGEGNVNFITTFNYTYLYGGGEFFSAVGGNNLNIKVLVAGTYDITFSAYSKIITIAEHAA